MTTGHNYALIESATFEGEQADCTNGGVHLTIGTDYNADGTLDEAEVKHEHDLCNGTIGADGESGASGVTALTKTTTLAPDPEVCSSGGVQLHAGTDDNSNGALDDDEIDASETLCNGVSLVQRTSKLDVGSEECPAGGSRYEAGTDKDGDLTLDDDEVEISDVFCNAIGVLFDAKTLASDPDVCAHGGLQILIGRDDGDPSGTAGDGTLQDDEVDTTRNICLAATDVLIGGGESSCSVTQLGHQRRGGQACGAFMLLGASLLLRRRSQRCAR